jgi:hypothetical protein
VAHDGSPDDSPDGSEDYPGVEPTQYANYGGTEAAAYSESADQANNPDGGYDPYFSDLPRRAWYHKPAVLIGLGVLTAAMLALLIYAIVDFTTAEKSRPAVTTVTSTATPQPPATTASPSTPAPSTTTLTVQPPVITTTQPPAPSTTIAVNPTVTTVTETTIERRFPRLAPRLNPPPLYEPPPGQ